jgi:predicted dehydrogenase
MTKHRYGICLVGCGMIGHVHARQWGDLKDRIDLYVCDNNGSLAAKIAEENNATGIFKTMDDALSDGRIDALDICLPHYMHYGAAMQAFAAGKHVFIEKPIANSLEEADAMTEKAAASGLVLAVLENFRYEPGVTRASELMAAGVIGEPFMINIHELSGYIDMLACMKTYEWRMKKETGGGGILFDRGIHLMAMANMLGGPVASVYAATRRPDKKWDVDEASIITLTHENGIMTNIILTWNARIAPPVPMMAIYGNAGSIIESPEKRLPGHLQFEIAEIKVFSEKVKDYYRGVDPAVICGIKEYMKNLADDEIPDEIIDKTFATGVTMDIVEEFAGYNVYSEAMKDFIECLDTGKLPRVGGREARSDIELVFAVYESARTGQAVALRR